VRREGRQVQEPGAGVLGLAFVQEGQGPVADEGGRVGGDPPGGAVHGPGLVVVAAVGQGVAVEAGRGPLQRPAVEELAGHGGGVARVPELAGHGGGLVELAGQLLAQHPVVVDIAAAEDRRPRRAAAGGGGEPFGVGDPGVGDPAPGPGHGLQGLGAGVVGHDHQHVGPGALSGLVPGTGAAGAAGGGDRHHPEGGHGHHHPAEEQPAAHSGPRPDRPRPASRPGQDTAQGLPVQVVPEPPQQGRVQHGGGHGVDGQPGHGGAEQDS